ncbi:MAG: hypothetical protein L0H55_00750 [Candidatus Nitrosocosmicus sp.]|nr:hypothetical protein [Candidatus Nitrosocosmicus sp.]
MNNTFGLSGLLVSTLNPSLISNNGSDENNQLITSSLDTNIENSNQNSSPSQRTDDIISIGNLSTIMNPGRNTRVSTTGTGQLNQTDNLSNNLVSMLSGIIIQSIEKGNPTIGNYGTTNTSGNLINENISIIVSGNWKMNVNSSKVAFFDSKFVMITSNAKGFHWHTINNFNGDGNAFFGTDDTIFIDGTVDFFTDDKLVSENSKVVIMINNFELMQIIFLDDKIADHFHNFPLYGIIDSIEVKN